MQLLFARFFYSLALAGLNCLWVIASLAQGTKLEGGVDSVAPSTTLTIRQLKNPSPVHLDSSIGLRRVTPTLDILPQKRTGSLHTGIQQDSPGSYPMAPVSKFPSLDVVPKNPVFPLNAHIELNSHNPPAFSIPILPFPRQSSLEFSPKRIPDLQLHGNQGELELSAPELSENNQPDGARSLHLMPRELQGKSVERRPDISIQKMTAKSQIKIQKVSAMPVKINTLPSSAALSISPVAADFIEINRVKPSELSGTLIMSARVRSQSPDISLNSVCVDIKLTKARALQDTTESNVHWDYWYEAFNKELAVAILDFANQVGNPSGSNRVMVTVSADGKVNCRILEGTNAHFNAVILAAYNRMSHSPFLRFPSGSVRKFVEFSVEHTHEDDGPVDEVRSSSIKGDSEKQTHLSK